MASPLDLYAASKCGLTLQAPLAANPAATRYKITVPQGQSRTLFRLISTVEFRILQGDATVVATIANAGRVQAGQDWPLVVEGPGDQFISVIHAAGTTPDIDIQCVSSVDTWSIAAAP